MRRPAALQLEPLGLPFFFFFLSSLLSGALRFAPPAASWEPREAPSPPSSSLSTKTGPADGVPSSTLTGAFINNDITDGPTGLCVTPADDTDFLNQPFPTPVGPVAEAARVGVTCEHPGNSPNARPVSTVPGAGDGATCCPAATSAGNAPDVSPAPPNIEMMYFVACCSSSMSSPNSCERSQRLAKESASPNIAHVAGAETAADSIDVGCDALASDLRRVSQLCSDMRR